MRRRCCLLECFVLEDAAWLGLDLLTAWEVRLQAARDKREVEGWQLLDMNMGHERGNGSREVGHDRL